MCKRKIFLGISLILLTFVCLFASVFPSLYSNNTSGKIYKEIKTDFSFLKNEKTPYVLLYFGYEQCDTICPTALNEISKIYSKLDKKTFSFLFINLNQKLSPVHDKTFIKAFNKNFKSLYLKEKEIKHIVSTLNIKYLPSLTNANNIDHSGFLHVLQKDTVTYKQKFFYSTKPFDIEYIQKDLNKLQGENHVTIPAISIT